MFDSRLVEFRGVTLNLGHEHSVTYTCVRGDGLLAVASLQCLATQTSNLFFFLVTKMLLRLGLSIQDEANMQLVGASSCMSLPLTHPFYAEEASFSRRILDSIQSITANCCT